MVKFNQVTTINDRKTPVPLSAPFEDVAEYFMPTILMEMDYFPFGMQLFDPATLTLDEDYRFGFNTQEKVDEIKGAGNHYTAPYWEYDPRVVHRWNVDPRANPAMSPYAILGGNPIWFTDHLGDTTFVSNIGNILDVQRNDDGDLKDNYVYLIEDDGSSKSIGEIGGDIDVNKILANVLENNKNASYRQTPVGWFFKVKKDGEWDYKNNLSTIFGLAWSEDLKAHQRQERTNKTNFLYQDFGLDGVFNAADIGNYNAGWTGTFTGVPKFLQVIGAGVVEQLKPGNYFSLHPGNYVGIWASPYFGDHPRDYKFNTDGMKDAAKNMKNGPRVLH